MAWGRYEAEDCQTTLISLISHILCATLFQTHFPGFRDTVTCGLILQSWLSLIFLISSMGTEMGVSPEEWSENELNWLLGTLFQTPLKCTINRSCFIQAILINPYSISEKNMSILFSSNLQMVNNLRDVEWPWARLQRGKNCTPVFQTSDEL